MKLNKNDNIRTSQGINTDASKSDQPEGKIRFALNAVDESSDGDNRFVSRERSNQSYAAFKEGFIQIGDVDIDKENKCVFFVAEDESNSCISIFNTLSGDIEDLVETPDLGFKVNYRIDTEYRLRLGCERVVYFTDGWNPPRIINLDKLKNYKDENDDWDVSLMNHIKDYTVPIYEKIEIISGGGVESGSYNFDILLLDEDFNPTNYINPSQTVNIYCDSPNRDYFGISGSSNELSGELQNNFFGEKECDKSIKLTLSNLDERYSFYRIAVIKASEGNGIANTVYLSSPIPLSQDEFIFDGNLTDYEQVSIQELRSSTKIDIETADHNEQIENRYLLANTKGRKIDWCSFQRYASQIRTTYTSKQVRAFDVMRGNSKDGHTPFDTMGFMANEVYSVNIVYLFSDGYESPEYHIPGRPFVPEEREKILTWNPNLAHLYTEEEYQQLDVDDKLERWQIEDTQSIAARELNAYSMQYWESRQGIYKTRDRCGEPLDYWGQDYYGNPLEGKPVRHHKMPSRQTVPLITYGDFIENNLQQFYLLVSLTERTLTDCENDSTFTGKDYPYECVNGKKEYVEELFIEVEYQLNGDTFNKTLSISSSNSYDLIIPLETLDPASDNFDINNVVLSGTYENYSDWLTVEPNLGEPQLDSAINFDTYINILGMRFDNIEYPHPDIIGHYITIGIRDDSNRTIIDKGYSNVLRTNDKYIAFNWTTPNQYLTDVDRSSVFVHNPTYLFKDEIKSGSYLKIEGRYIPKENFPIFNRTNPVQDVVDGTSSSGILFGLIETDDDGIDWIAGFRWTDYYYGNSVPERYNYPIISDLALTPGEKIRNYKDDKTIYNVTLDNKCHLFDIDGEFPYEDEEYSPTPYHLKYVSIVQDNDVYPNVETVRTYKAHTNYFTGSHELYGGDTYISHLPNTQSNFYNTDTPKRFLESIFSAWLIVVSAVLTVVTAGATTPILVGAAAYAAVGLTLVALKTFMRDRNKYPKLQAMIYDDEIRGSIGDVGDKDDLIRYGAEHISSLFVESEVNVGLRTRSSKDSRGYLEDSSVENIREYIIDKYIYVDEDRENKESLRPVGFPEIYFYNKDYSRLNLEGGYSPLPLTYDCCSECLEEFPNKMVWSEQSFQDERSDNYRTILQNNYRNINSDFGEITDVWTFNNKVYIHTEKMLFVIVPSFQEQIKDDLSTFIGTGEFFSLPEQKITDDDNGTLGSNHKWATLKSKMGVIFVCEREGKYMLFDGQGIKSISDIEKKINFRQIIPLLANDQYQSDTNETHPLINTPSNPYGLGFISTYDAEIERFIFTKKDIDLSTMIENELTFNDYRICPYSPDLKIFRRYEETIFRLEQQGWDYDGISENCQMVFKRVNGTETVIREEPVLELIPSNTDVWIILDNTGSFDDENDTIKTVAEAWTNDLENRIPNWEGDAYVRLLQTERWLDLPNQILQTYRSRGLSEAEIVEKNIVFISFINEAYFIYHGRGVTPGGTIAPEINYVNVPADPLSANGLTDAFNEDYSTFINDVYDKFKSFRGILYPIVMDLPIGNFYGSQSKVFLNHAIASMEDGPFSFNGVRNQAFTNTEWQNFLNSFQGNIYRTGLKNYGWSVVTSKFYDGSREVITYEEFDRDIYNLLLGNEELTTKEFEVEVPVIEYRYIDPITITEKINASHTWSFSLKYNQWRSAHSYLPYYYMRTQRRFFSNIHSNYNIWKHNVVGSYGLYYDESYPFILEIIFNKDQLNTRLWDHVHFITEAKRFDTQNESFVNAKGITFNKVLFYNTKQCSGIQNIEVKDQDNTNFFTNKINKRQGVILAENREENFFINNMRDYVVNYDESMFIKRISELQGNYYIDKIVNNSIINFNKNWTQVENFRDKFLVARFFLEDMNHINLIAKYFTSQETYSL